METSLQLSFASAGIAITMLGIGITLMVQWAALPKKNQIRNLAFGTAVILFILGAALAVNVLWNGQCIPTLITLVILGILIGVVFAFRSAPKKASRE